MKAFFATLFFAMLAHAGDVPIPRDFLMPETLVEEFRDGFRLKLDELKKTFQSTMTANSVAYTSNNTETCSSGARLPWQTELMRISHSVRRAPKLLSEVVDYKGCRGRIVLKELVRHEGENLQAPSFQDLLVGVRSFYLRPGQTALHYHLEDENGVTVLEYSLKQRAVSTFASFRILGQTVVTIDIKPGSEVTRVSYIINEYDISYSLMGERFRSRITGGPFTYTANVFKNGDIAYAFRSAPMNPAAFKKESRQFIMEYTLGGIAVFLKLVAKDFPPTEFVSTGGGAGAQRVLNELRVAVDRLINNRDLNLVKLLLQQYIEHIEQTGKIRVIDNRDPE